MSISDYIFKILLIGDVPSSKTAFVKRYCYDLFNPHERSTIGVDFYSKTVIFNSKEIKLQIWDFGVEKKLRFLFPNYCKNANGAFFMYDITAKKSLDHLIKWVQMIREYAGNIPIMLIGSKLDLRKYRAISQNEVKLAVKEHNLASFLEISSKTGENVDKAFDIMINLLIERYFQNTIVTSKHTN
ncbi:MAG: Rab family GTPase [Candidatus Thorarchaeota archaeon]